MKVQVSGEGGYIVSASRREFPGSKSHWPNDLTLGVVGKGGSVDVWPAPHGTQTHGNKPPPRWRETAERLLNSPAARRAILAGLKKYRREMRSGTWGFLVKLSDGRKNVFSTARLAMDWGQKKLDKMPNFSAYGLFHQDPKSPYHAVPFELVVKNEYGVSRGEGGKSWEEIVAASTARRHERGGNPKMAQKEHFQHVHAKSAAADQTMLDLLYGSNPISDNELRKLIAKRPHVYGKYAAYLGTRLDTRLRASRHESGKNPLTLGERAKMRFGILSPTKAREAFRREKELMRAALAETARLGESVEACRRCERGAEHKAKVWLRAARKSLQAAEKLAEYRSSPEVSDAVIRSLEKQVLVAEELLGEGAEGRRRMAARAARGKARRESRHEGGGNGNGNGNGGRVHDTVPSPARHEAGANPRVTVRLDASLQARLRRVLGGR